MRGWIKPPENQNLYVSATTTFTVLTRVSFAGEASVQGLTGEREYDMASPATEHARRNDEIRMQWIV